MAECIEAELKRRLCLYQTFIKLYEHHGNLIDEILQLESLHQSSYTRVKSFYLQGVIDNSAVYVTTNLSQGRTQSLEQPQCIWTIGRDKNSGIPISDSCVSRRHAAIYYISSEQNFYLVDFESTNGSYVNGEQIFKAVKLKDGDHIRLGNTTFDFFLNISTRVLPTVVLEQLMLSKQTDQKEETVTAKSIHQDNNAVPKILAGTEYFDCDSKTPLQSLHFEQPQEILDYFLSQKSTK
ncbi:MAG: FHA domain-containing protein [Calothrix sp. C42_A2020_038]|nr:FHA domain-containing protein [Calothrix sp. C42_A2020_038]